jgi:cytochrome oxidase Cu insertion factor (SCO1/SenC/PrrC family)
MKVILTILIAACAFGGVVPSGNNNDARAQARKKSTRAYVCPMHQEVRSTRPGKCSKCGMALRLVKNEPAISAVLVKNAPATSVVSSDEIITPTTPSTSEGIQIPDTPVLDQNGKRLKFYTDLVRGKTVAINFVFTTCTTICPALTATFRRVQVDLGEHAGRDVQLISVSVDPTIDVPERLRDFAAKFKAAPGWTFVTGNKSDIDVLLKALGAATADKNDHTPMVLIGNERSGYWTRMYGLSPPATIARILAETANQK